MKLKVGDIIYVPTSEYRGDDFVGGKAKVYKVLLGKYHNWIMVNENPGIEYNWSVLKLEQEILKEKFGNSWAHRELDYLEA